MLVEVPLWTRPPRCVIEDRSRGPAQFPRRKVPLSRGKGLDGSTMFAGSHLSSSSAESDNFRIGDPIDHREPVRSPCESDAHALRETVSKFGAIERVRCQEVRPKPSLVKGTKSTRRVSRQVRHQHMAVQVWIP